ARHLRRVLALLVDQAFDEPMAAQQRRDLGERVLYALARQRAIDDGGVMVVVGHGGLRQVGGGHPREDDPYFLREARRTLVMLVEPRVRRHRGEPRRLLGGQARCGYAEIVLRGGLGAEYAAPPFDDVEVELEDAPLVEHR